jgi:hypothetical protein
LSGLVIIVGGELNAEIEHAASQGKDVGEKVPGQRKAIGRRAERRRQEQQAPVRPDWQPLPATIAGSPMTAFARTGAVVGGAVAALFGRGVRQ